MSFRTCATFNNDRKPYKMLVRQVLSDTYRTTQEQFQYQGVEILMSFRTCATVNSDRKPYKMLVLEVLSDRYRTTQEQFQYQEVET